MVLSDEEITMANIYLKLEQNRLTQADKNNILSYAKESPNNFYDILRKIIGIFALNSESDVAAIVKNIENKYNLLGLDEIQNFKWIKNYLSFSLGSPFQKPEKNLEDLKNLIKSIEDCPDTDLKNGIYLIALRWAVLSGGVAKDVKFSSDILDVVNKMTEEEKISARIPY